MGDDYDVVHLIGVGPSLVFAGILLVASYLIALRTLRRKKR